ncbi:carbohydrate-binding family 9-like protein [Mucilaginibacter sp. CSA2-8R]|uniref:carbohydrate-binding family 9-like protein n=1 Tax=Mucilaginibacter sp. CSA2-8R TaxID=3141542 RepID=UPI00315CAAF6
MQHVNDTMLQQNVIKVPALTLPANASQHQIDDYLNGLQRHPISNICWLALQNAPEVKFALAYKQNALFIKYYTEESTHLATYTISNEPVFKDSCVEFFIAVDDSGSYYNFEFNSLGTCLASYGTDRHNRIKLSADVIANISYKVNWFGDWSVTSPFKWELMLTLPVSIFCFDEVRFHPAQQLKVNFYKCGDNLPEPHYLAWNPVLSPVMDFHQPRFFGALQLV